MVELIIFILMGAVALAGALGVVLGSNPVYAAISLMATLFALAVFYVVHLAHFVAAVQVIVYAGAVITLFLFVIMFIGVDKAVKVKERLAVQRPLALIIVVGVIVAAGFLVINDQFDWVITTGGPQDTPEIVGTVEEIGSNLIRTNDLEGNQTASPWLLTFEATSVLLIVAAIGAITLAFYRSELRPGRARSQSDEQEPQAVPNTTEEGT